MMCQCIPLVVKHRAPARELCQPVCGRAVLTVSAVPTPTLFPFPLLHTLKFEPACGCAMASPSNGKKEGWQLLSVHLDGGTSGLRLQRRRWTR